VPALGEFISNFLEETNVLLFKILCFGIFLFLDFLLLFVKGFGIFSIEVLLHEIVVALGGSYELVDAWDGLLVLFIVLIFLTLLVHVDIFFALGKSGTLLEGSGRLLLG
jgi:hypothetical protein